MGTPLVTDVFFEHQYVSVPIEQVYLDAILLLRSSLVAGLVDKHAYIVKVEDTITQPEDGRIFRAAYVDSIQVTTNVQTKHRPTGAPRSQYNAIRMNVKYTEYSQSIDDNGALSGEGWTRGATVAEQISLLAAAAAEYEKGRHIGGTLHTGGGPHAHLKHAVWPEMEILSTANHEEFQAEFRTRFKNSIRR